MDLLTVTILSIVAAVVILLIYLSEVARREDKRWDELDDGAGVHEVKFDGEDTRK